MTEQTRKGIILFSITDRGALYSSYMSFAKNGGVFIPTTRSYDMGDEVFVLLKMMDDADMIPVRGNVVWVTPAGAQGNKAPGIGVQFSVEDAGGTQKHIELLLAASLNSDRATQTM